MEVTQDFMAKLHLLFCDITDPKTVFQGRYLPKLDCNLVDELAGDVAGYLGDEWFKDSPTPQEQDEISSSFDKSYVDGHCHGFREAMRQLGLPNTLAAKNKAKTILAEHMLHEQESQQGECWICKGSGTVHVLIEDKIQECDINATVQAGRMGR